jgi:hypothetical protein
MTDITSLETTINHNRNVTEEEQQLTSSMYNGTTSSFIYSNDKEEHSNNNNHKGTIEKLDLAYGLIELLVKNNYTLDSLINTNPSDLSRVLAIDQEVAAIICAAVNKKNATMLSQETT